MQEIIKSEATKVNGWGGAGRGQGRKPLNGEKRMVSVTITLTEEDVAFLDDLKYGGVETVEQNRSAGVRWALRSFRRERKALMAEAQRAHEAREADPSSVFTDEELERDIAAKVAATNRAWASHVEN